MGYRFDSYQDTRRRLAARAEVLRKERADINALLLYVGTLEWRLNSAETRIEIYKEAGKETCPNGLTPDGDTCPKCGCERAPSGVDGGSWVHVR